MTQETTNGLRPDGTDVTELPPVAWGIATGTVNAIAVTYDPAVAGFYDGLILGFRASGANTSASVTFNPSGIGAKALVKGGGKALLAGDIPGLDADVLVRYNQPDDRWEVLNPYRSGDASSAAWAVAGGTVDAITATFSPAVLALTDGLIVGVRASGPNTVSGVTFSPNGLTARTIVKSGGQALLLGDIYGANAELLLRYDLLNTRWELLNPYWSGEASLMRILDTDAAGQNVSTAQPWFPTAGGVLVTAGLYEFEGVLTASRAAGTTSHTTSLLFGGSATVTVINYRANSRTGDADVLAPDSSFTILVPTAASVKAASTSATEQLAIAVKGMVVFSGIGTFIPQFQYSAAPGGAPTIRALSFFKMRRINAAANAANQGPWA